MKAKDRYDGWIPADFVKYCEACRDYGANFRNIKNIAAHWLYGTDAKSLAVMSRREIVYNPPGHRGGRD